MWEWESEFLLILIVVLHVCCNLKTNLSWLSVNLLLWRFEWDCLISKNRHCNNRQQLDRCACVCVCVWRKHIRPYMGGKYDPEGVFSPSTTGLESKQCIYGVNPPPLFFLSLTSCNIDSHLLPGMPLRALNCFSLKVRWGRKRFIGISGCAILIKIKPLE